MKKILMVGADVALRSAIADRLMADSFDLVWVEDLSLVNSLKSPGAVPQLIVLDLDDCSAAWQESLCHWRQNAETTHLPIILLASANCMGEIRQGMELGADDYLVKPFGAETLWGAIQARLQRRALLDAVQQQTQLLAQALKNELASLQNQLQDARRVETLKSNLLKRVSQDLREPLANINMALHLLKSASSELERDRYISVLQAECSRELALLDDISEVQTLLTPDKTLLLQKFQMLATT